MTAPTDLADRSVALALALLRGGAAFTVVGSTATRLVRREGLPADLDVSVEPQDVPALCAALTPLSGQALDPRTVARQCWCRVHTWLGPVDVFVGAPRGRVVTVALEGVELAVVEPEFVLDPAPVVTPGEVV